MAKLGDKVTKISSQPVVVGSSMKSKSHPKRSFASTFPVTPDAKLMENEDPESTLVEIAEDETSMVQPPKKKSKMSIAGFSAIPSPPLKLIVGTEDKKQVLYIKKEIIFPKSKLIRDLYHERIVPKRDENQLVLVDVAKQLTLEIFVIFLVWVVSGDIECAEDLTGIVGFEEGKFPFRHASGGAEAMTKRFEELVQCWILGLRLQAEEFQDVVIDKILEVMKLQYRSINEEGTRNTCSNVQLVNQIYQQTPPLSPLRRLIRDYYATSVHAQTFVMDTCKKTDVEREFLDELLLCTMRWVQDKRYLRKLPWEREVGCYHCFKDGERKEGKEGKVVKRESVEEIG